LDRGASPNYKNQLAVMVAIHQKDVVLVKMLIEREPVPGPRNKRRRLPDRVKVNTNMLSAAVKCDAREIVEYLAGEKECVPSLQTLRSLGCAELCTAPVSADVDTPYQLEKSTACYLVQSHAQSP
jgi:hypothetical protein